jgi:hypothetical protein
VAARAKRFLVNLAVAAVALAIAGLLGEAVVRLLYKRETVLFPRYHTDYRYGRYTIRGTMPNADYWMTSVDGTWRVITNSRGFRNTSEFAIPKPAGIFRVLSLGDSHTQGYEVRQDFTFSAVLERALNRDGRHAEVINAGVSGYSTAEALVFLENEGIRYAPDIVVLGFSANDFEDNVKAGLFAVDRGRLSDEKYEYVPGVAIQNVIYRLATVRWLSENSYFYSLLFNNAWNYFKVKVARSSSADVASKFSEASAPVDFEFAVANVTKLSPYQIDLAVALVDRMHRFCQSRGIRLIVVDIPGFGWKYRFVSSVPAPMRERLHAAGVELVSSEALLGPYEQVAELHLPNGYHHISEFTHTAIALELGRRAVSMGAR